MRERLQQLAVEGNDRSQESAFVLGMLYARQEAAAQTAVDHATNSRHRIAKVASRAWSA